MSGKVPQEPPSQYSTFSTPFQFGQQQRPTENSHKRQPFCRANDELAADINDAVPSMYQNSAGYSGFSPAAGYSAAISFPVEPSESISTSSSRSSSIPRKWRQNFNPMVGRTDRYSGQWMEGTNKRIWKYQEDWGLATVNAQVQRKSVKQCKDKIPNLKQANKNAKAHNKKTGRSPRTSPFFNDFDEIFGMRPVVTMPGVVQAGLNTSSASSRDSEDADTDADDEDVDKSLQCEAGDKRKKPVQQKPKKKRARKTAQISHDGDSPFIELTGKILDMQKAELEMMERGNRARRSWCSNWKSSRGRSTRRQGGTKSFSCACSTS